MSDATIPLSDLRKLWRHAKSALHNSSGYSIVFYFRGAVREEIARRTIAEQSQRIIKLEADSAWLESRLKAAQAHVDELRAELAETKAQIYQLECMVSLEFEQAIEASRRTSSSAGVLTDEVREAIETLCASIDRNAPFELYQAKVIVKAWLAGQEA